LAEPFPAREPATRATVEEDGGLTSGEKRLHPKSPERREATGFKNCI